MSQSVFETQPKNMGFNERLVNPKTRKMSPRDLLFFLVVI